MSVRPVRPVIRGDRSRHATSSTTTLTADGREPAIRLEVSERPRCWTSKRPTSGIGGTPVERRGAARDRHGLTLAADPDAAMPMGAGLAHQPPHALALTGSISRVAGENLARNAGLALHFKAILRGRARSPQAGPESEMERRSCQARPRREACCRSAGRGREDGANAQVRERDPPRPGSGSVICPA